MQENVLTHSSWVWILDLGVMVMKGHFTPHPRPPETKLHYQMQFSVIPKTTLSDGSDINPMQKIEYS